MGRIIEKNCKTSIVNGRIIVSDSFKSPIIEDDVAIRNLQPFQIYGRKVVPCRVTTDSDATNGIAYMPQIGGIDMDEPNAALTGSGSFYLNVTWKYDVGDLTFKIDPDNVPFISNENLGAMLSYEVDIDGNVGDFLQNISSWRIGGIEAGVVQNYMRYFHGYEGGNVDATENNIYKKGRFFPDEWGVASIGFVVNGLTRDVPDGDDLSAPVELTLSQGKLGKFTNNALTGYSAGNAFGTGDSDTYSFLAQAKEVLV